LRKLSIDTAEVDLALKLLSGIRGKVNRNPVVVGFSPPHPHRGFSQVWQGISILTNKTFCARCSEIRITVI